MRSWLSRQFVPSTPLGWLLLVGLLVLGVWIVVRERMNKNEIDDHPLVTCGTIIEHERSGHSGRLTRYEYYVDGTRYVAVAGGDKRFGDCVQTKSCIGLTFEVEYAERNPSNSRMVWSKPNCTVGPTVNP